MITLSDIKKLSIEERLTLVESIWDSITEDTSTELQIPSEEKQEILKRFDEFKRGDQKTYSWDEVKVYVREP
ncbi:MAG: addiction module protein [Cyclobacteriaceae bacterium]|nr:addiction module protein [Cyclobacteriaceae bacterium]